MPDQYAWSTSLGRWWGVSVRVHALLVLMILVLIACDINSAEFGSGISPGTGIITALALLVAVFLHEFAHRHASRSVQAVPGDLILSPWGGSGDDDNDLKPGQRFFVFSFGPLINLFVFFLIGYLITDAGYTGWRQMTNPFQPFDFDSDYPRLSTWKIFGWVNFQLALINLIPCFPFDGAQILRSFAQSIGRVSSHIRIEATIMMIGIGFGLALMAITFFMWEHRVGPANIGWIVTLVGGFALIYLARYSFCRKALSYTLWDKEDVSSSPLAVNSIDESDYNSFDFSSDSENAIFSQWMQEKQEERMNELIRTEEEEDHQADLILAKLHDTGIVSLTNIEKEVLDRVSARIRRRRQQGV